MRRFTLSLLGATLMVVGAIAQEPAFSVASVKPNTSSDPGQLAAPRPDGGFVARNTTVVDLLVFAYGLRQTGIVGGPDWIRTERFDIEARPEPNSSGAGFASAALILRSLLRERFGLATEDQQRALPVYALRVARPDRRLGPGLKPVAFACSDVDAARRVREAGARASNGETACTFRMAPGSLRSGGMLLGTLGGTLLLDRPVRDETGLTGFYEVTLEWAPDGDTSPDRA